MAKPFQQVAAGHYTRPPVPAHSCHSQEPGDLGLGNPKGSIASSGDAVHGEGPSQAGTMASRPQRVSTKSWAGLR